MNPSLRLTLTFWYVGILTAILCLFGCVLYSMVAANRLTDTDQLLVLQANSVADNIEAFWQAEAGAQQHEASPSLLSFFGKLVPPARTLRKEVEEGRFPALLRRWAQETGELDAQDIVRILDRRGHPLEVSTGCKQAMLPLTKNVLARAGHGRTVCETITPPGRHLRLVSWPVVENGRTLYLVQIAASLLPMDASLKRLRTWLLWLIPLTLVVASAVGWFLASTALRPVRRMITQAQKIGVERLHERIDAPRTGDELELLATTFNDMLGRLEQAFRRMRQFSAAASHELRTPLTVMRGELEVALRRPRDSGEYQRVLRTHLETLNEMTNTVEQLLALARSEGDKGALEWTPLELGVLARQVRETWQPVAETKKIQLEVVASDAVWVRGERRLMVRLIGNLLDNAIRHTPPEGSVRVIVASRQGRACLLVQDTGRGISPEALPGIFDKFFTRSPAVDGSRSTGLGLGLCRWIAEAHEGYIEVESAPGKGTTFMVWLPVSHPSGFL